MFKFCCIYNSEYCIKTWIDKKKCSQEYSSISFTIIQLPCFTKVYSLYYLNNKKIVPTNIEELLTSDKLAYWFMSFKCLCIYLRWSKVIN